MRKIISIIILLLVFNNIIAQDYPKMSSDENGNKLVIFTEPQVQNIDSLLSLLSITEDYKKIISLQDKAMSITIASDSICNLMLIEKDNIINKKDLIIINKDEIIKQNENKIENLNKQIVNLKESDKLLNDIIKNKDEEIKIKDGIIRKWKYISVGSWLSTAAVLILLL